ncbi:MAG: molybdopterin-dependent oxidoreductase [Pseudomonadota bacterium]
MSETTVIRRACNLCEAICGLRFHVRDNAVVKIEADPDDPLSLGHICPKAIALQDIQNDPDRLRQPHRRRGEGDAATWEPVSWDEALDEAADALARITQRHGIDALGVYFGNPSVHNYGMLTHQKALFSHLKTRNRFSATSVDQLPHHLVSLWLYGHKDLLPIPDIDRTDFLLILGGNPMASNGSIWTVPAFPRRARALTERGGQLVVIDPRRTETAKIGTDYLPVRPGTDALFLLAMLQVIFEENLDDLGHLEPVVTGLDAVREAVAAFAPERVAEITGIPAPAVRRIARTFATADRAACYGRMGLSVQRFGTLNHWLIQLLNIVTGNLDREGGMMLPLPAWDTLTTGSRGGFGRHQSRVRGLPEFARELPVATLAEEALTPGPDQIRALFTGAGNPVLSTPDGNRLDRALAGLEFMVSLDPYINETTRHAHLILPPTPALEHDHYDLAFLALATRNTARFNPPVLERPPGALHDWEIFNALGERVAKRLGSTPRSLPPPHQMADQALRHGPYADSHKLSLATLQQHPSGIDLGPLKPQFPDRLFTDGKTIACDHPRLLEDLDRCRVLMDSAAASEAPLLLIGRRHVRSNNSWMHNYHRLVKGPRRDTLLMHPQDIDQLGLTPDRNVRVRSRVGQVEVTLEPSEDMMPGVVSLPHGFGHNRPWVRLGIATQHPGASCNDLTDPAQLEPISGNAVLNGVPVSVETVASNRDEPW